MWYCDMQMLAGSSCAESVQSQHKGAGWDRVGCGWRCQRSGGSYVRQVHGIVMALDTDTVFLPPSAWVVSGVLCRVWLSCLISTDYVNWLQFVWLVSLLSPSPPRVALPQTTQTHHTPLSLCLHLTCSALLVNRSVYIEQCYHRQWRDKKKL